MLETTTPWPTPEEKCNQKIEYRYLNLDTKKFVRSQPELVEQVGRTGTLRSLLSYKHDQCLIGASSRHFTEVELRMTSQRLTGVNPLCRPTEEN
jgi:hypothetical protein